PLINFLKGTEMLNKYPVLKKEYIIRKFNTEEGEKIVLYGIYDKSVRIGLNKDALFIVKHFTGEHSVEDIVNKIVTEYHINRDNAFKSLNNILAQLKNKEIIFFNENRRPEYKFPDFPEIRGILNQVYIRLTNACNLKCRHCSVDAGYKLKDELNKEEIFDLIDQLYNMMVPSVTFTGGEPTLVNYLPELVKYTSYKPIKVYLMTNGFRVNKQYAELLVRNGLVHVNISLDGANAESHDTFRGVKGSFKKAIEAIRLFKKLGIYVETTTVIHDQNSSEVIDIVNLGKFLRVDNMKFLPITPFKRGKNCNFENSLIHYTNNLRNFLYAYNNIYNKLVKKNLKERLEKENLFRCGAGMGVIAISSNGDVFPCNNLENIILGNIRSQKLIEIYNNSSRLEDAFNAISVRNSECEACEILDYCHGGCAMLAYTYNGDYKKCDITRKPYIIELMKDQGGEK
ncbi:MAG: PqqD family peptide modification chaperone, partial [Candidatus Omnitrophica bacterium]|nr:PqqD family peptide modification chaperone [Candidatus Omnitrophota bacterium]